MSIPDKAMGDYFRLVTRLTPPEITGLEQGMADGNLHPRDVKMKLAREMVEIFDGPQAALEAERSFITVFQQGNVPQDIAAYRLQPGQSVLEVLVSSRLAGSNSEARRLIDQKGIRLDGEILSDPQQPFPHTGVLQAGKRRFVRVEV